MSPNILNLTSYLKSEFGFEVYMDLKCASTYSDHRALLRKQLYKKTKNKTVFDLDQFPSIHPKFVSISHCPVMGGFVLSDKPVGLDLEQAQRLSHSVIQRISKDEERALFSENQMRSIWAIKESVYKCEGSFNSNIPSVHIQYCEQMMIGHQNFKALLLRSVSVFKDKQFETLTFMCEDEDLLISISF